MATIPLGSLFIDPAKTAKYPITVSEQLLGEAGRETRQHALLHFNHKPKLSDGPHETTITQSRSQSDNSYDLSIKVDDDGHGYSYTGPQRGSETCALIYDPKSQTFTLDKISTEFTFNLCATPTNKDSKALASQYPKLATGESEPESNSDDLFDENDPSTGADVNNPYDYRHFLKRRRTSSPEPLPATPLVPASPPRHVPARQKPKPKPYRAQQKRAPSPPPREEADADNEDSDDGGLTIEFDTDARPRRMIPFTHDIRNGPISLASAASSVSPTESVSSDEDEDVGKLSLERTAGVALTPGEEEVEVEVEEEEDEDEEDEEEEDEAVEEVAVTVEEDDGEAVEWEDDALEAELEQALESQADEQALESQEESGGVQVYGNGVAVNGLGVTGVRTEIPVMDESSSESEEE
ncbi:hypothetical protein MMC07_005376 [Pseudocyphellaria aurata]|nr:hypothetical protein [Pseudocyphellaria aurata]